MCDEVNTLDINQPNRNSSEMHPHMQNFYQKLNAQA